jgi:hypothetical protein
MSPRTSPVGFVRRAVALVTAVACCAALAACSGDDDDETTRQQTEQEVKVPGAKVRLDLASVDIQAVGDATTLDDETKVAVMTQTRRYVEEAVVRPLLTGRKVRGGYGALFGPNVKARAIRADRAALTDEGVGTVTGDVRARPTKVAMHALVGGDGTVALVATNFDLRIRSEIGDAPLKIDRDTELTFEKAGDSWVVNAYRVVTTRSSGAQRRATTASSEPEKKS